MSSIKHEIENLMKGTNEITASIYDFKRELPFISTHPTFYHEGFFISYPQNWPGKHIITTLVERYL
jgi:hypothetical protein